jgi:hypothetical protein
MATVVLRAGSAAGAKTDGEQQEAAFHGGSILETTE